MKANIRDAVRCKCLFGGETKYYEPTSEVQSGFMLGAIFELVGDDVIRRELDRPIKVYWNGSFLSEDWKMAALQTNRGRMVVEVEWEFGA